MIKDIVVFYMIQYLFIDMRRRVFRDERKNS